MSEKKERKNRSTAYIIPILSHFISFNKNLLINSYLYDINEPELNIPDINGIFILFRYAEHDMHKVVEENLRNHESTIKVYDVDDEYFMVFIKFSESIIEEIKLILEGKYSRLKTGTKSIILNYYDKNTKLRAILFKDDSYRKGLEESLNVKISPDAELGSVFNFHDETFGRLIKLKELN